MPRTLASRRREEAIAAIDQSGLHLRAIVVADTSPASYGEELRRFLREAYAEVPLVDIAQVVAVPEPLGGYA